MVEHTKGELKVFNLTDIFTNTHPLGKGDIQIADCAVHKKILDTDRELPLAVAGANAKELVRRWSCHEALVEAVEGLMEKADDGSADFDDPEPGSIYLKAVAILAAEKEQGK